MYNPDSKEARLGEWFEEKLLEYLTDNYNIKLLDQLSKKTKTRKYPETRYPDLMLKSKNEIVYMEAKFISEPSEYRICNDRKQYSVKTKQFDRYLEHKQYLPLGHQVCYAIYSATLERFVIYSITKLRKMVDHVYEPWTFFNEDEIFVGEEQFIIKLDDKVRRIMNES